MLEDNRYRLLVESVRDYGIFMLDAQGIVISWNPGAQLIKGYEADEIIGQHFSRFYEPADVARGWPAEELVRAAADGRFEDENWRLRKDGTRFWAGVVITAMRDASGKLIGFAKVTRDLTERRRHNEELRQSEEQFRLLMDGVRDYAIIMLDASGHVRTWNEGAQQIIGYTAEEIVGRHFSRFYPAESIERLWPEHELSVARLQGRFEEEGWRVRRDGSRFWASVVITALRSPDGELAGFAKVTQDITQRQRLEALQESAREMTVFLAMLSHELRNPLAPIRNAVAVLEMSENLDRMVEWSRDVIGRQVGHLSRLVDDLLDVSRITSGKIVLVQSSVDLRQIVVHAVEGSRTQFAERHHTLTEHLPDHPVFVNGDPTRLTQVVTNLLSNAAKYTPDGGQISITLQQQDREVVLCIKDSGVGLAPDMLERAFELFAQGERTLARSEGGLGVGLTLVRRLVEMHGGTVSAKSAGPGQGSTFDVRLPAPVPNTISEPITSRSTATNPSRRRILVVDDNADSVNSMKTLLTLKGHDVVSAYDGPEALAMIREFRPALVLLDIGLPGMSGYDVARAAREDAGNRGMVLCAVTGYGQNEDRRRSRDAGFDHHLVKPVDMVALEAVINGSSVATTTA